LHQTHLESEMPRTAVVEDPTITPVERALQCADALLRAAAEAARQHEQLGRCLERGCSDAESKHLAAVTALCDAHLDAMTAAYEAAANAAPEAKEFPWWHAANTLWHASREYSRRHAGSDRVSRLLGKHSKEKLAELTMEYELERSALMAVKQAASAYRAIRPDAE
jgi:hypothetical protein